MCGFGLAPTFIREADNTGAVLPSLFTLTCLAACSVLGERARRVPQAAAAGAVVELGFSAGRFAIAGWIVGRFG